MRGRYDHQGPDYNRCTSSIIALRHSKLSLFGIPKKNPEKHETINLCGISSSASSPEIGANLSGSSTPQTDHGLPGPKHPGCSVSNSNYVCYQGVVTVTLVTSLSWSCRVVLVCRATHPPSSVEALVYRGYPCQIVGVALPLSCHWALAHHWALFSCFRYVFRLRCVPHLSVLCSGSWSCLGPPTASLAYQARVYCGCKTGPTRVLPMPRQYGIGRRAPALRTLATELRFRGDVDYRRVILHRSILFTQM